MTLWPSTFFLGSFLSITEYQKSVLVYQKDDSEGAIGGVLRHFKKFRNIHLKIPLLESIFNKVAGLHACNFIKKRLQQWCFPVNITKFLRTPFSYRTTLVLLQCILCQCIVNVIVWIVPILGQKNWLTLSYQFSLRSDFPLIVVFLL